MRSLKRSLALILLICAVYAGFTYGRTLGAGLDHRHGSRSLSHLLSLDPIGFVGGHFGDSGQDGSADASPADVFDAVLDHVQHEFVEGNQVSNAKLTNGALARMLASLDDPKTAYLDPALRQTRQDELKGRFHGIGTALTIVKTKKDDVDYRHLSVVDVMPGSPAEKAGLQPGDRITEIDGRWIIAYARAIDFDRIASDEKKEEADKHTNAVPMAAKVKKGEPLARALSQLTTGEGKTLQLTVERPGQATPLKLEVTTAETTVDPVEYHVIGDHIGDLHVRLFNPRATEEMQAALSKLDGDLKGLVIDLRSNPGGVKADEKSGLDGYSSALRLIGWLTRSGAVATIEHRLNQREPLTLKTAGDPIHLPLVVLVDQGTANLAELVAAALHDTARAKVIGTHTFGDNVLQLFAVLKNGSGIEMSTAHFLTLSGADLGKGIEPDIVITTGGPDAALQRALTALGA